MLALAFAGCQKTSNTDRPKPVSENTAGSSSQSVAAPPNTLPPSDATIKPADSATSSGNAASPTQANPTALSKTEEKTSMPHSGQVNNHSTPESVGQQK
jgi:hypothetical protein